MASSMVIAVLAILSMSVASTGSARTMPAASRAHLDVHNEGTNDNNDYDIDSSMKQGVKEGAANVPKEGVGEVNDRRGGVSVNDQKNLLPSGAMGVGMGGYGEITGSIPGLGTGMKAGFGMGRGFGFGGGTGAGSGAGISGGQSSGGSGALGSGSGGEPGGGSAGLGSGFGGSAGLGNGFGGASPGGVSGGFGGTSPGGFTGGIGGSSPSGFGPFGGGLANGLGGSPTGGFGSSPFP